MLIKRQRIATALALSVTTAVLVAGCTAGDASDDATGGGDSAKLTLGMTADITGGWDVVDQPSYQGWAPDAVYDTLVTCLPGGELAPDVAEKWEISDDKKSFTAHIREGMTFSDGSPVDAAAVQRSYEILKETASDRYGDITFDAPDENTITISWPDPQPLMNQRACVGFIASIEYLDSDDRKTAPVGSGPYTYDADASTAGSAYTLKKNPDHWNSDAYPYETVELRVLADETASLNALKTGQIDGTVISAAVYDEAESSGLDIISQEAGLTMIHLTDRLGEKIPALGDVRVRQAMNMVVDKQEIVNKLYDGHATPISQPLQKGSEGYIEDLEEPYPFDVEAAKKLMSDAGYEDGFTLTVPTMEGQAWTVMLPYLTQQFAELNITLEQDALSGPDAIGTLLSGDYPVPVWNVGASSSVEDISVHILDTGFWNVSHQPNETVTELWQQIVTGDEQQSVEAQQEINRYVTEQAWFVPILSPEHSYAYNGDKVTISESTDPTQLHPLLIDFQ
jgi:ABC-type transport system substrate-binding protein